MEEQVEIGSGGGGEAARGPAPGGAPEEAGRPRVVDRRRRYGEDGEPADAAGEAEKGAPPRPSYVEQLERKVALAEERLREHIERINKESAEFRARQERELERRTQEARKQAVGGFLSIADDLGRAAAAAAEASADEEALAALIDGVRMIQGRFLQELAALGVAPFESVGQRFNPERHEAVRTVEVTDPALDGVVAEELGQGYMLGEDVLRPSRVSVGKLRPSAREGESPPAPPGAP